MLACEGVMMKKSRTFMLALGVSVGTAALIFLVSLIFGAKAYVDKTVGAIRENLLEVKPKETDSTLANPLDDQALGAIKATTKGLVKGIYRELPVDPRPAIKIKDAPPYKVFKIVGVDEDLFRNNPDRPIPKFHYRPVESVDESKTSFPAQEDNLSPEKEEKENYIPVLVPNIFMEFVNTLGGADSEIAKLFRRYAEGRSIFYIVLDNNKAYPCRVVSQDNNVSRFTIAVPIKYAEEWNDELHQLHPETPPPDYTRFVIEADNIKDLDAIKAQVLSAGYLPQPTEVQNLSIAVSRGAAYLLAVAVTFCLVIALVAAIGIFNGLSISIMEQAPRIGILRSVGGTRIDISYIYLLEAIIIGLVGGIIGLVASYLFMWGLDIALKDFLSDVTNLRGIDTLFVRGFPQALYIWLGAIGLSVLTSLLAGVSPAYRASRLNPAVVLRAG